MDDGHTMGYQGSRISELSYHWISAMHKFESLEKEPRDFGTGDFLTRTEIHAIMAIGNQPGINITSLADFLKLTKSAISQIIRKLSEKNLVEKYRNDNNDKEVLLCLTPKGRVAYLGHEQFHAKFDELFNQFMVTLDDNEFLKLKQFLISLCEAADTLSGQQ